MELRRAAVSHVLRGILGLICKVDCAEFREALAKNKPLLVAFNHINFLEVPILVAYSYPLKVTGLVKSETWKNPLMAFLFDTYRAIPLYREGAAGGAFRLARERIDEGFFMCLAPEGRRSRDGILGRGKPGVIQLAMDADIPILPVAHHGGEHVWANLKRLRRTPFSFKAGRPFRIRFEGKPDRLQREAILDEVMGRIARLLPEPLRGPYAEKAGAECRYLEFLPQTAEREN